MNSGNQQPAITNHQSPEGPQMAVYCQPCLERRATESPAKYFPGGTPMCDACFGGRITKPKEKETMPKKIEIDLEKLKALCAQGVSNGGIGKQLGCTANTVAAKRRMFGLPPGRTGRPQGNGSKPRTAVTRAAIASAGGNFKPRRKADAAGTVTVHLSAAALDRLWEDLSLETKADLIEQILGN